MPNYLLTEHEQALLDISNKCIERKDTEIARLKDRIEKLREGFLIICQGSGGDMCVNPAGLADNRLVADDKLAKE